MDWPHREVLVLLKLSGGIVVPTMKANSRQVDNVKKHFQMEHLEQLAKDKGFW